MLSASMLHFRAGSCLTIATSKKIVLFEPGKIPKNRLAEKQKHYVLKGRWQCKKKLIICAKHNSKGEEYAWRRETQKLTGNYGLPAATSHSEYASVNPDVWSRFKHNLNSLYQFSRPHTMTGTIIAITSFSLLTVDTIADLSPTFFMGLLKILVTGIFVNIYGTGLNQLYDVELDKINKPYLPIASGDFSMETGITIVAASLLVSVGMGFMFQSPPILAAILIYFALSSAYSIDLPYLRWKKQPFVAASCILIVRAIVFPLASFIHMQKFVLGKPIIIPRSLMFGMGFMCFLATSIAILKDIPDVDGDKHFGIQTFSVKLGRERVFWVCVNMLLLAFGAAMVVGASSSSLTSKLVTILGHCALGLSLWMKAKSVDITSQNVTFSFYMFIWKIFYAEHLLIPFMR